MSIDAGTAIVQPIKETSSAIKFPCADYPKGVLDFADTIQLNYGNIINISKHKEPNLQQQITEDQCTVTD